MASTHSPTRTSSEDPSEAVGRPVPSILISAMSVVGSVPTTSAPKVRPSLRDTVIRSASSMTWLFVIT